MFGNQTELDGAFPDREEAGKPDEVP
jgi:hypothetical protein